MAKVRPGEGGGVLGEADALSGRLSQSPPRAALPVWLLLQVRPGKLGSPGRLKALTEQPGPGRSPALGQAHRGRSTRLRAPGPLPGPAAGQ